MPQVARSGRARISMRQPRAMGECDRCSRWNNHASMVRQFQWSGNALVDTGLLVCRDCADRPQQQLRSIILPPDPRPIINARPSPNVTPIAWRPVPVTAAYLTDEYGNVITDEYGNPIALDVDATTTTPAAVLPTSPENQGFTVYNLDSIGWRTYPTAKAAVLAEVASLSGIPTPAQVFDRSIVFGAVTAAPSATTTITLPLTDEFGHPITDENGSPITFDRIIPTPPSAASNLLMGPQGGRNWLLLYNPVVAPVQIALATSLTWGAIVNLTLGPGEAFFWADAQLLLPTWKGAIAAEGLLSGMPFYAWESGGDTGWLTTEDGTLVTDENGQAIPLS